jgi:hypothetical protein
MAVEANPHPTESAEPTLPEVLSVRALATPRSRLVIESVGGLAIAIAAVWLRPPAWFSIAAVGALFGAYGAWAIAEQRLEDPRELSAGRLAALELVQRVAGPIGIAAALALAFGLLSITFGLAKS